MTDVDFLRDLAQEFRNALEVVVDKQLYGRLKIFGIFPKECCRYASDLLAEYIISHGVPAECIRMIDAKSNAQDYTHCWLVVYNTIVVDITADQFKNESYFEEYQPIPSSYVEMCDVPYLHSRFYNSTMQSGCNVGINSYDADITAKLKVIYDAVLTQIKCTS